MKSLSQKEADERVLNKCNENNYTLIESFIYKNNKTKIHLKCNIDLYEWYTSYNSLLNNRGCYRCSGNLKLTQKEAEERVLNKCIEKNYTLVEQFIYNNSNTKIHLKCNKDKHEWFIKFSSINDTSCIKCCGKLKLTQKEAEERVLNKCIEKNYTLVKNFVYKNSDTKNIHIKCNKDKHEWFVSYYGFINVNTLCPKCVNNIKLSQQEAIENIENICKERDYTLIEPFIYQNCYTKIYLKCNKDKHEWIVSYDSITKISGCPKCGKNYKMSENKIKTLLEKNKIKFISQYRNKEILGRQSLDFYLNDYNIAIEYQGKQHFKSVEIFGGIERFKKTLKLDENKFYKCENNNIKILYFTYEKNIPENYLSKIYTNENDLIEEILNTK